jgi:hypothetical protein
MSAWTKRQGHRTKKRVELAGLRADAVLAIVRFGTSERGACQAVEVDRSSYHEPKRTTTRNCEVGPVSIERC